jgi:hypothetical protein
LLRRAVLPLAAWPQGRRTLAGAEFDALLADALSPELAAFMSAVADPEQNAERLQESWLIVCGELPLPRDLDSGALHTPGRRDSHHRIVLSASITAWGTPGHQPRGPERILEGITALSRPRLAGAPKLR